MEKMKKDKACEKIREEIRNNPGITKGDLEDKFPHSTVWYNIYSNKGKLKKEIRIELKPTSKGQTVDTYYLITPDDNLADPEDLKILIKNYESSTSLLDTLKQIEISRDIHNICGHKKIKDEEFIKFLIKHCKKEDDYRMWLSLGSVASKLLRDTEINKKDNADKEKSLLKLIRKTDDFFENIVFDRSKKLPVRNMALQVLRLTNHPGKFDIAFKLLEKIDTEKKFEYFDEANKRKTSATEFETFIRYIESLIHSYNKIDYKDCRKKLYDLLDANRGSMKGEGVIFTDREAKVRDEILYLLETTRGVQRLAR